MTLQWKLPLTPDKFENPVHEAQVRAAIPSAHGGTDASASSQYVLRALSWRSGLFFSVRSSL